VTRGAKGREQLCAILCKKLLVGKKYTQQEKKRTKREFHVDALFKQLY
jgi:hypothetical protein